MGCFLGSGARRSSTQIVAALDGATQSPGIAFRTSPETSKGQTFVSAPWVGLVEMLGLEGPEHAGRLGRVYWIANTAWTNMLISSSPPLTLVDGAAAAIDIERNSASSNALI